MLLYVYYKGGICMAFGVTFKRYEKKFLLNPEQFLAIKEEVDKRFDPDKYGETKICNIYYDTSDDLLIRRSIEKPAYKEKLRLRSYGTPTLEDNVFLEIKISLFMVARLLAFFSAALILPGVKRNFVAISGSTTS